MANKRKGIYYPRNEGEIEDYFANAASHLAGALGIKYGTDPATVATINSHKTQIPIKKAKAYADRQTAQQSTAAKKAELRDGKKNLLRELNRITRLANWDEKDGGALGIRKEKSAKDLDKLKPQIKKVVTLSDKIEIHWAKKGMSAVSVEWLEEGAVTSSASQWVRLGEDTFSPFVDKRLNKTRQPENRFYRLRYLDNDKPVGLYSEIVHAVAEIYPVGD